MAKRRTYAKKLTIQNFKIIKSENLLKNDRFLGARSIREEATIVVIINFTPRGYNIDLQLNSPIIVWDFEQACKLKGITETNPEGDLVDQNFPTELSAMHFITRRLSKLGWEPTNSWEDEFGSGD